MFKVIVDFEYFSCSKLTLTFVEFKQNIYFILERKVDQS